MGLKLVPDTERGIQAKGVWEWGAWEDSLALEGRGHTGVQKAT